MYPGHIEIGTPMLSFRCGFLCVPIQPYSSFPTSQVQWMSCWLGQAAWLNCCRRNWCILLQLGWVLLCVESAHTPALNSSSHMRPALQCLIKFIYWLADTPPFSAMWILVVLEELQGQLLCCVLEIELLCPHLIWTLVLFCISQTMQAVLEEGWCGYFGCLRSYFFKMCQQLDGL